MTLGVLPPGGGGDTTLYGGNYPTMTVPVIELCIAHL